MTFPVIRLEVQGLQQTMIAAVSEHFLKLDAVNQTLDNMQ